MSNQGNGADKEPEKNIVHFPTLADRDRARKEKLRQEKQWQKQYRQETHEPFFRAQNIPPFTKIFTLIILAINIPLLFFPTFKLQAIYNFGFAPANFTDRALSLQSLVTPLSHMFLHGDLMHLAFNTVMMLALGTFFEKMQGTRRCVVFFLLCGLTGALTFLILQPHSPMPVIGASGAISGLFAAVILMMHSEGNLAQLGRLSRFGAWPILLFWLGLMIVMGLFSGSNIAWQAHVGGFVGGIGLYYGMKKRWINF